MNEIAIYEGYVITLTKYKETGNLVFLSNDENPTKQIINAMIFRTFEKAQSWIDLECSMIVESEISDFEITPFCCEFKY